MKIDNFALSGFQTCRAKYYLRHALGYTPVRKKPALSFGGVVHNGLAEWYRTGDLSAALRAIEAHWPEVMPTEDFRTKAKALETIYAYTKEYPTEVWKPIATPSGVLVEQPFTIPTGLFLKCGECKFEGYAGENDYREGKCSNCNGALEEVEYGGLIDVGAFWGDMVYVVDHKTTTRLGDGNYYFMQYKPDNQMTGYIWGLGKLSNQRVGGALISAIGLYKAKPPEFKRQVTNRSERDIAEWLRYVLDTCNDIKQCERSGVWRMETGACMQYGQCDYHAVHTLPEGIEREKRLENDYVVSHWNYEERDE